MSTNTTIDAVARVYATSLLELAEAAGGDEKIAETGEQLAAVVEIVHSDPQFAEFLRSPIVKRSSRGDSIRRMLDGQVSDLLLRFLLVLNDKGRLGRLADVSAAFEEILNERFGKVEVDVFTVDGRLDDAQVGLLAGKIRSKLGKEPVFHQYKDPSLIGGLVLRVGDQLIDGSVRGRLRGLRESLLGRGTAAIRSGGESFYSEG
ncbi:MAG: ATP synthase F1 subunit delta [Planctomycetota bacterium]|nr:ATP synthase F1 subunit delta [Planctomycetota bacterium]MEE2896289.1 ATP synthase F1 subunit delta [Planctomycetota bacterium]